MSLIYEHWRLDTNECFYIGKAEGEDPYIRAYDLSPRNRKHKHIVAKLNPLGLIAVRTSDFPNISTPALNNLEILAIAHWKMYIGKRLTNIAKGGDGGDTFSGMSEEQYAEACAAVKAGHAARSAEEKKEATRKRFQTLDARTPEEVRDSSERRSKGISLGYANRTEEQIINGRKNRSSSAKQAHANKSPEKKKADGEAIRAGKATKRADPNYVRPMKTGRMLNAWYLSNVKHQKYWGA